MKCFEFSQARFTGLFQSYKSCLTVELIILCYAHCSRVITSYILWSTSHKKLFNWLASWMIIIDDDASQETLSLWCARLLTRLIWRLSGEEEALDFSLSLFICLSLPSRHLALFEFELENSILILSFDMTTSNDHVGCDMIDLAQIHTYSFLQNYRLKINWVSNIFTNRAVTIY